MDRDPRIGADDGWRRGPVAEVLRPITGQPVNGRPSVRYAVGFVTTLRPGTPRHTDGRGGEEAPRRRDGSKKITGKDHQQLLGGRSFAATAGGGMRWDLEKVREQHARPTSASIETGSGPMTQNEPPTESRPSTVTTEEAARALHLQPAVFEHWANKGLATPAAVDPDGTRWWNLHDLRRELARYLADDQG